MTPLPTPRVLLVEDDVVLAMRMMGLLEDMGSAPVGPVSSVVTALPIALHEQLDAALLDVRLVDHSVEPVADVLERRGGPFSFVNARPRGPVPPPPRGGPYNV